MTLYIATLSEVKTVLGISDTDDDTELTMRLEALQGRLDMHCRRRFLYSAAETEYFDGGMTWLLARRWPITSVTEIIIDQDQGWDADDALESDDYKIYHARGRIAYGTSTARWPEGFQNIRVRYAGGFVNSNGTAAAYVDEGELETLRRAFLMQAEFEWRNKKMLGVTSVSADGAAVGVNPAVGLAAKGMTLLPEVEQTLMPLRRMG